MTRRPLPGAYHSGTMAPIEGKHGRGSLSWQAVSDSSAALALPMMPI